MFWLVYFAMRSGLFVVTELLQACYCNSGIFVELSAFVLELDLWLHDGVVCMGITVSPS